MLDHFSVLDTYGEQNAFISEAINYKADPLSI